MFNLITTERIHGSHKIPHVTQVLYSTTTGTTRAPMIPFDRFIIVIISFGWNMYRYLNRIKFDTLNCQRIYIAQVTPRPTITTCHGGYTWNDTKNKKHNPTPPSDNLIASVSTQTTQVASKCDSRKEQTASQAAYRLWEVPPNFNPRNNEWFLKEIMLKVFVSKA